MELVAKYQSFIYSTDYMFVNGIPLFNTYICDIRFITSRHQDLQIDRTMQAMKSIQA